MFFQPPYLEYLLPALYALVISFLAFFLALKIYLRFRERQNKPLLYLSLTYFFYAAIILTTDLGYFYQLFFGFPSQMTFVLRLWLLWSITLSLLSIANYFHLCFGQELFSEENKRHRTIFGVAVLITVVLLLSIGGLVDVVEWKYILVFLLTSPIYLYIMIKAFQNWKQASDPIYIRRYQMIFLSVVFLPPTFVFILVDTLLRPYIGDYGPFFYLAWLMAILSSLAAYYAYVPPPAGH
ncbi:MAG: hypothetical protein ACFFBD_19215 [Candidatus Hodarchaeota archaeon]